MNTSSKPCNSKAFYPDIKIYLEEEDFIASLVTAVKSLIYAEEMLKKKSYINSKIEPIREFFLEPNKSEEDFKNNVRLLIRKHNDEVRERVMEELRQELYALQEVPSPELNREEPLNSL